MLSSTVTSLGALTSVGFGTVTYDAPGDQAIVGDAYYNLTAGGGSGIKTLGGIL